MNPVIVARRAQQAERQRLRREAKAREHAEGAGREFHTRGQRGAGGAR